MAIRHMTMETVWQTYLYRYTIYILCVIIQMYVTGSCYVIHCEIPIMASTKVIKVLGLYVQSLCSRRVVVNISWQLTVDFSARWYWFFCLLPILMLLVSASSLCSWTFFWWLDSRTVDYSAIMLSLFSDTCTYTISYPSIRICCFYPFYKEKDVNQWVGPYWLM
jgi:hypothetical protein